jgi:hypothetical protein
LRFADGAERVVVLSVFDLWNHVGVRVSNGLEVFVRLVVRWALVLVIGAYLYQHYAPVLWRGGSTVRGMVSQRWLGQVRRLQDTALAERPSAADRSTSRYLPRHDLTPGAIDPRVTQANIHQTICRRGYTRSVRPPYAVSNRLKHRVMRTYGVTGSIHDYELDHLIPLELGGCPDCQQNLWPEPRNGFPGADAKDEVEDYLNRAVCRGVIPLAKAQQEIARDWYAVYRRMHGLEPSQRGKGRQQQGATGTR